MRMPRRQCAVGFAPFSCASAPPTKSIPSSEFTSLLNPEMVLSIILRAKPINRLRSVDAGYAISIAYDQKHQSDPGCPETEAARGRAHRDHFRLAGHIDRSPYGRGCCRAQLS